MASSRSDQKDSKSSSTVKSSAHTTTAHSGTSVGAAAVVAADAAACSTIKTSAQMPTLNRNAIPLQLDDWKLPAPLDLKDISEKTLFDSFDLRTRLELAKTKAFAAKAIVNTNIPIQSAKPSGERDLPSATEKSDAPSESACLSAIKHSFFASQDVGRKTVLQEMQGVVLARNILRGKFSVVNDLLSTYKPNELYDFLTTPFLATDWRGQRFEMTPYQMALAVEDTQMAELIKQHLDTVAGVEEANAQYHAQFPKGWEQAEEKRWAPVFAQLELIALAVKNADLKAGDITAPNYDVAAKEGSPVKQALDEFWRRLDAVSTKVIRTGRAFNPKLLARALQIYDEHYNDYFGNDYDDPRALLFVQKVIGKEGIQGVMPANYMQAFHDGLTTTADKLAKGILQGRGSMFDIYRGGGCVSVDFLSSRPRGVPGFNFCLFGGGWSSVFAVGRVGRAFRSLCQSKAAGIQNLCGNSQIVSLSR